MKIYKFYLKMSHKEMLDLTINSNIDFKYQYHPEDDTVLIFYAWTDSKKMRDKFISQRTKQFIYSMQEVEELSREFLVEYKECKLDSHEYNHYDRDKGELKPVAVVTTLNEFLSITEYPEERLNLLFEQYTCADYKKLNDEYIDALDTLLYTMYHDIFHGEDESVEDFVLYQKSYGLTPNGNPISDIVRNLDELNILIYTYSNFFKENLRL